MCYINSDIKLSNDAYDMNSDYVISLKTEMVSIIIFFISDISMKTNIMPLVLISKKKIVTIT